LDELKGGEFDVVEVEFFHASVELGKFGETIFTLLRQTARCGIVRSSRCKT
jgi:hypothetical protein